MIFLDNDSFLPGNISMKRFSFIVSLNNSNLLNIRLPQIGESENQQVSKIEYALSIGMAKGLFYLD